MIELQLSHIRDFLIHVNRNLVYTISKISLNTRHVQTSGPDFFLQSPTRLVQRIGRTGRKKDGRVGEQ